jgi:hypothetical protein
VASWPGEAGAALPVVAAGGVLSLPVTMDGDWAIAGDPCSAQHAHAATTSAILRPGTIHALPLFSRSWGSFGTGTRDVDGGSGRGGSKGARLG